MHYNCRIFLHPYICFDIIVVHVLEKIKLLLKDKMHGEYNVKNSSYMFRRHYLAIFRAQDSNKIGHDKRTFVVA